MSLYRIPPMSREETLKYYSDGTIPQRFRDTSAEYQRHSVLSNYGAPKPVTDQETDADQTTRHSILDDYT